MTPSMEKGLDERFTEAAARAASATQNPDGTAVHNISTCVVLDFQVSVSSCPLRRPSRGRGPL